MHRILSYNNNIYALDQTFGANALLLVVQILNGSLTIRCFAINIMETDIN